MKAVPNDNFKFGAERVNPTFHCHSFFTNPKLAVAFMRHRK